MASLPNSEIHLGGLLAKFPHNWATVIDTWVLDIIRSGYTIKILYPPLPKLISLSLFKDHSHERLLLNIGVLVEIFPKKKGGWRPILALCQHNILVCKLKFCMVTLASIIPSLEKGTQFTALSRYFHVDIHTSRRRSLRFVVGPHHYRYKMRQCGHSQKCSEK